MTLTGQPTARLYPESETALYLRPVEAEVVFRLDADENVAGLTLNQDRQSHSASFLN